MSEVSEILDLINATVSGRHCNQEPSIDNLYNCLLGAKSLLESHAVIERQTIEEVVCVLEIEGQDFEREILQVELDRLTPTEVVNND